MIILGERIRALRKEKKFTLRDLGDRLNMSFSILAMYERGERTPPVDKLILLADFFNVSTDYLLGKSNIRYNSKDKNNQSLVSEDCPNYYKTLPKDKITRDSNFYMQVKDDSMIDSRIYPGDSVLVHIQNNIENGKIALIKINTKTTLIRKVYRKKDQFILQAANIQYGPLLYHKKEIEIIGKIVKVEFEVF